MKVYITENIDRVIENYKTIPIIYGKADLSIVPNNAATHIVAIDALDSIPFSLLGDFIKSIQNKLRAGGHIVLGGLELTAICQDLLNNNLDTQQFNETILNKKGLYKNQYITNLLTRIGLKINNVKIKGYNYEITASRPQVSN